MEGLNTGGLTAVNRPKLSNLISLSKFTSLRVGGAAEWLAEPKNLEELQSLISWTQRKQISYQVIGAGSNLLISDKGIKGLTICMKKMHGYKINSKTGIIDALLFFASLNNK